MFSFFHHFEPQALFFSFGWLHLYWYGLLLVLAIIAAMLVSRYYWKKAALDLEQFDNLSFWLIISGIFGARIYEWFLNYHYYATHLGELWKIWHGGLAIHGAILGAFLALLLFARKHRLKLLQATAIIVPGLALGQAIGRFGNYFNQELFGRPTALPWGIFISPNNRPLDLRQFEYFHPTFLYESLACLLLFLILFFLKKHQENNDLKIVGIYFLGYGVIRFLLEYIRIDQAPELFGFRWPQIASLIMITISGLLIYQYFKKK